LRTVASLTEEGWVQDSKSILGYVIDYYILSDSAQSITYQGNIINLPNTYYININNPTGMVSSVKSDLDKLLSRYFPIVDVNTEVKEITKKEYAILLYVSVYDEDGRKIELSKVVELNTSGVKKVFKVNNYGSGLEYLASI